MQQINKEFMQFRDNLTMLNKFSRNRNYRCKIVIKNK